MRFVRRRKWVRAHRLIGLVESEILHALSFISADGKKASMEKIPVNKINLIDNPIAIESKVIGNDIGKQNKNNNSSHNMINKIMKRSTENVLQHEVIDHEVDDVDEIGRASCRERV